MLPNASHPAGGKSARPVGRIRPWGCSRTASGICRGCACSRARCSRRWSSRSRRWTPRCVGSLYLAALVVVWAFLVRAVVTPRGAAGRAWPSEPDWSSSAKWRAPCSSRRVRSRSCTARTGCASRRYLVLVVSFGSIVRHSDARERPRVGARWCDRRLRVVRDLLADVGVPVGDVAVGGGVGRLARRRAADAARSFSARSASGCCSGTKPRRALCSSASFRSRPPT